MSNPRRAIPLTEDQRRERNRRYQQTRREKTNNSYARAYRRASQRATAWVQKNQPQMWQEWLDEELERGEDQLYTPITRCSHDHGLFIMGIGVGCLTCGKALGSKELSIAQREHLADMFAEELGLG